MKNTKKLNLEAFKLKVSQDGNKIESLIGGRKGAAVALASCHPTGCSDDSCDADKQ